MSLTFGLNFQIALSPKYALHGQSNYKAKFYCQFKLKSSYFSFLFQFATEVLDKYN